MFPAEHQIRCKRDRCSLCFQQSEYSNAVILPDITDKPVQCLPVDRSADFPYSRNSILFVFLIPFIRLFMERLLFQ